MVKKLVLWVYEYKDDETPIGATIFRGTYDKFYEEHGEEMQLPHLSPEWHMRIQWMEEEAEEDG